MTQCAIPGCTADMSGLRKDAQFCGQRHRQAHWRFISGLQRRQRAATPHRIAYADPPYPGMSDLYRGHPDYAGEVDHAELVSRLELYDGWALSTWSDSLADVLALCPPEARVAAWFRGERKVPSSRPLRSWEPVIYVPARAEKSRLQVSDSLIHRSRPRTTDPKRVIGAKPAAFCWWLFDLLTDVSDSSPPARLDMSLQALNDASEPGCRDGSQPGRHDESLPRGRRDASVEYSGDTL